MRRLVISIVVSIAALLPAIALRGEQEREQDRERRTTLRRQRAPRAPAVKQQRQSRRQVRAAFDFSRAPSGTCQPDFGNDISGLMFNTPGNGWVTVPGDCSGEPGCNDFFILTCNQGSIVQASFCSNGGQAFWNTNLSVWDRGSLLLCEDDSCGQQSEIFYPYSGGSTQRFRIGGTNGDSGSYTLAVNVPANCFVGGPVGVELQSLELQ